MSRFRNITTALAAVLLTAPAFAYDIQTPGNDTKLSVYGFVYALANYYTTGAAQGNTADLIVAGTNQATNDTQQFILTAQPSRWGFASTTPTAAWGDITTKLEFDYNNLTEKGGLNFRHYYATVGGFLMGKTWSLAVDGDAGPDSVNWQGALGDIGFDTPRHPQIRYTWTIDKNSKFAVSLEKNIDLDGDTFSAKQTAQYPAGVQDGKIPTITASYSYYDTWGHVKVSGVSQAHAEFVGATNSGTYLAPGVATAGNSYTKNTFTGFLSGDVKFGKDDLVFSFYDGSGTDDLGLGTQGTYFTSSLVAGNFSVSTASYDQMGWVLGYTHVFTPQWRANIYGGGVTFKANSSIPTSGDGGTGVDIKNYNDIAANVFFTFTPAAQMGLEYYYETAKTFGAANIPQANGGFGDSAKSGRIQLLLQVKF